MKKTNWKLFVLAIAILLTVAACEGVHEIGEQPPILSNDLESGELTFTNDIPGECVDIVTTYSTDYSTSNWRITDSKTITIRAYAVFEPGCEATTPRIFVEHMHADVNMEATKPIVDGWTQDSMDDKIHGSLQPGFYISETAIYEEVFAVEAYTEQFMEGWGYYVGYYGSSTLSSYRPTENELAEAGVYGSKIVVVFDIALEDINGNFHGRSFVNEMLVPTSHYDDIMNDYWNAVATATAETAEQMGQTPEPSE